MKRKVRQRQWKGLLPKSSEIIGSLAHLCGWQPRTSAQERTWRKFCNGEHIQAKTRRAILEELVSTVVHKLGASHNIYGEPLSPDQATQALSQVIGLHAGLWDLLCKRLESALPAEPTAFTTTVALRLASVELAMRIGGMFALHGVELAVPTVPPGKKPDINRVFLPNLLREVLKSEGISRNKLADAVGVSKEAVDQWLEQGAIIRPELLEDIAEVISEKSGADPQPLAMGLRVMRQLTRLLTPLADAVGREELGRLFIALVHMTAVARAEVVERLRHLDKAAQAEAVGLLILTGGESELGRALRPVLVEKAPDPTWKRTLSTPPRKWEAFLTQVATVEATTTRTHRILQEQGLPSKDQELLHQDLLTPSERTSEFMEALSALSPDEGAQAYLVSVWRYIQALAQTEPSPQVLSEFIILSEILDTIVQRGKEPLKALAEDLRWRCQGLFILGCMKLGRDQLDAGNHSEAIQWGGRVIKAVEALPPIPSQLTPENRVMLNFLGMMKRLNEEMKAGTVRIGPQDFQSLLTDSA